MNKLLKDLYDCFYTPPELAATKREIEECHRALIEALASRSADWCSRSLTQKTALRRIPPSTASSPDFGWRGGCPQN